MKTLITLEVVQFMTVLVESDDSVGIYAIADAVDEAYSNGLLYEFDLGEDTHGATVLDALKSDATEAQKAAFERAVAAYVHPKNKFTLDELLEEDE